MSRLESLTGALDLAFPEYAAPPEAPSDLLQAWLARVRSGDVREPNALTLGSVSLAEVPSARVVVPISVEGEEVRFSTHIGSRKGKELLATGQASGLWYWRELGRQIAFSATATCAPRSEACAAWSKRPAGFDPISCVSRQSEPMCSSVDLTLEVKKLDTGEKQPCPERFVVFRLRIQEIEFWQACASRVHKRLAFHRSQEGWTHETLQP